MAANEISVYQKRPKAFALQWRQGGLTGPPINVTGAVLSVLRTTLPASPDINLVDGALGKYELVFTSACTAACPPGTTRSVTLALTFPDDTHSPDPVTIQVVVK